MLVFVSYLIPVDERNQTYFYSAGVCQDNSTAADEIPPDRFGFDQGNV